MVVPEICSMLVQLQCNIWFKSCDRWDISDFSGFILIYSTAHIYAKCFVSIMHIHRLLSVVSLFLGSSNFDLRFRNITKYLNTYHNHPANSIIMHTHNHLQSSIKGALLAAKRPVAYVCYNFAIEKQLICYSQ